MKRFRLNDYPWDEVERTKRFISGLFAGPAPDRPASIVHPALDAEAHLEPPTGLSEYERAVWQQTQGFRRRPLGGDDYVPSIGTGAGTCAMATAFGAEETLTSNVYWVKPCIATGEQIDGLRKPRVTDGKLGRVLEQTRAYAACADERLPIRVMDFQSPFTTVEQLLGSEWFFTIPYDDPRRLHAIMDVVTDYAIEFFQAQLAAAGPNACPGIWPGIWFPRCAGIQMSDDNLVNVSPEIYEEFVVPYNNRIADAFGGLFLHSCTITANHVAVLHKLKRLTGLNCDISTSVPVEVLLREFGDDSVVAPHAYINTNTNFPDYGAFMHAVLDPWKNGKRLFVYPCTVMYLPGQSREIRFDEAAARAVLDSIPSWRRDRGAQTSPARRDGAEVGLIRH